MWIVLVLAVPVGALALSARWLLAYYRGLRFPPERWVPVIVAAVGATAIYGLLLLAWHWRLRRRARVLEVQRRRLGDRAAFFEDRTRRLAAQVELLSAMREVSRIVSDEVRFERILDEALRIVQDLVGAESVSIFLIDEAEGGLRVAAHRGADHQTRFGADIAEDQPDYSNIEQCLEYHTILRTLERDSLSLSVPLDADQEPVGVLKIVVRLAAASEEWETVAEAFDAFLPEIARHVALAVKTTYLHSRAVTDGQTGLYNKRHFLRQLTALFDFSRRYEKPLALVMADLDHFKRINDTYGHVAGDMVLAGVAQVIRRNVRKYDVACRYGGEEMAVLMPETGLRQARHFAERLRRLVREAAFGGASRKIRLTVSCGVAAFDPAMQDPQELVALADEALYHAKETGRNRTCTGRFKKPRKKGAARAPKAPDVPASGGETK